MAKRGITVFFQTEQKIIYDELQYLREETRHAKSIDKIIALFNYFGGLNKFFYHELLYILYINEYDEGHVQNKIFFQNNIF